MMKKSILSIVVATMTVVNVFGWGQKGHDVVAYIAEQHLTPKTKAVVDSLLNGQSMVYWSNWLDNASHTDKYAYTKTWHYKNIDADQSFDAAPIHPQGDIVTGLMEQIKVLKSDKASKQEAALALKIVVHLVGDLHQPMHMGHKSDIGGNKWTIKYFGKDNNLHKVWDSSLVESTHKWSYTEWQVQIDRVSESEEAELIKGDITDWAKETHILATAVYADTPQGTNISYDYIADCAPVIEIQLLRGGLRLAHLLNTIYDAK